MAGVKIVANFPPDVYEKENYIKFTADVTGGELLYMSELGIKSIIKRILRQKVHAHSRGLPLPEASCLFASKKIYTPHFNVVGVTRKSSIVRSKIWNRYDKVIALTEYAKRNFVRDGVNPKKVEVLPLCIDYRRYQKIRGGKSFRKKFDLGKNEPFVLVVGMREGKNVDVIIDACAKAGVRCVLVGKVKTSDLKPQEGGWLLPPKSVLEMSKENAIFTGKLSDRDLLAAFDAATMYAISSNHTFECFSLSTYQCAASGVPLLLPDFGVFDVFKRSALFHRNRDSVQLSKNILKYLNDSGLRKRNAKRAKDISKDFDRKPVTKLYEEFYRKTGFI